MFKKIFVTLIIFIGVSFGGLYAYVSTIDWNKHKNKIAEHFEEISGKKIVFEGPVSLEFFPSPYLSAKDIKIYNRTGENQTQPLAVISEMVTELSLLPLLQGQFIIDNMSLLNANILIDFLPNGKLNWYSEISDLQRNKLDTVEVSLNSVLLKDANVQIINDGLGINVILADLNAEVTAESLSGPYRIDGNFVKDGNPAGFALNLGTLTESFATSLNLVLTHPTTESYARFDGSMLSSNKEIKGNFIIESKKPSNFINELTNQVILPQDFNYPLACSIELITNDQQIDLSSFIIKYGDNTAGAGNILIPLKPNPDEDKRKIEAFFEMTDLDLMPIIGIIKEQLKRLDKENIPYNPFYDFDLIADLKAVKANLNNQPIRNFNLSLDLINDVFYIKDLSGLMAGDTDFVISGDVFENNQLLTYRFNVKSLSQDFLKFLDQLGIRPKTYAPATYSNANFNFDVLGTLKHANIQPLTFTIDKTSANGYVEIMKNDRIDLSVLLNIDNINFDHYLPPFTEEEKKLSFDKRLNLVLNKLKFMQDYNIKSESKIDLAIYHQFALEKINFQINTTQDKIKVKKFNVENINDANLDLSGELSYNNNDANLKNVKYSIKTSKFKDFTQKFGIQIPNNTILHNAQKVSSKGIFTGTVKNLNIKSVNSVDKSSFLYSGVLFTANDYLNFNGNMEFRTPDFVDFVNKMGYNYKPQYMAANIFTFKGNVGGYSQNWTAKDIDAYIGANNFKGELSVVINEYPQITANISANNFEFDRFIYNPANNNLKQIKKNKTIDTSLNFLKRPSFDATPINYDLYKDFELTGKFSTDNFSINNLHAQNLKTDINIKQGLIKVENITAKNKDTNISANLVFDINSEAKVKGDIKIDDFNISDIGGKKYEFLQGRANSSISFDAPATSEENFIKGLNAQASIDVSDVDFKGWDLAFIEGDLKDRTHSDGLFDMLRTNLQSGNTFFNTMKSMLNIKNGIATLKNANLITDNANVAVTGNIDIINWTIDTGFTLTFNNLKDTVLPVTYQWNGSLNNPNLVINSSALKEKYDSHWEKIRLTEEAAQKAKKDELDTKMKQAQSIVTNLIDLIEFDVLPRLRKYEKLSSNIVSKNNYATSDIVVSDILNQLYAMQELPKTDFNDDHIVQIHTKTEIFDSQINNMIRELDDTYKTDIQNHAYTNYALIKNIYDNAQTKTNTYQETLNNYVDRLIAVQSLIIIDNEPKVADYKNKIETSLRIITDFHNKALLIKDDIVESSNITDMELQQALLAESLEKIKSEMDTLNSNMQNLFDYTTNLVKNEENEAIKKQEQIKAAQENAKIEEEKAFLNKNIITTDSNKYKSKIIIIEEGQSVPTEAVPQPVVTQPKVEIKEEVKVDPQPTLPIVNTQTDTQNSKSVTIQVPEKISQPVIVNKVPEIAVPVINSVKEVVPSTPSIATQTNRVPFTVMQKAPDVKEEINTISPIVPTQVQPTNIETVKDVIAEPTENVEEQEEIEEEPEIEEPKVVEELTMVPLDTSAEYRPKMVPSGIITKPASSKKVQQTETDEVKDAPVLRPISTTDEVFSSGTIVKKK